MREQQKLRLWLDSEFSINHAYYWAILGAVIGGWFWWVAVLGIATSIIYATMRAVRLPKNYLSVKGIPLRTDQPNQDSKEE